ncbi:hypothetical protein [Paracoccus benzoatiresistens]|uniref:Uncharacterized protein n=1 Tax=Paracoccus benzoatiresistens TaxID=2997341 RepID=A0ABT4J5L7_9RHOB|nr:hypothetical protein [Paracoccus sp. EF6]MCZ0962422.1 hypothetical protein [Paracoccus sp. EF6]
MSATVLAARSDAALIRFLTRQGNGPQGRRIRQVLPARSRLTGPPELPRQAPAEVSLRPTMPWLGGNGRGMAELPAALPGLFGPPKPNAAVNPFGAKPFEKSCLMQRFGSFDHF